MTGYKNKEKVLILSDLHCPFHNEKMILDIINKHRFSIDTIIFGGDIIDCESVSFFPKENRKSLVEEMVITYNLLNKIDKLTPDAKKILIKGNHEHRFDRFLAENKSELNIFHSNNILENIVNGFSVHNRDTENKTVYSKLSDNFIVINKWFVQYGDIIVSHPTNYSKIPLKTATMAVEHFVKRGMIFNTMFIGHTHKWGDTFFYSKWIGELGCLCMPMEYSDNGNVNYTPQIYGYAVITLVNGITDYDNSKLYRVEEKGDNNSC